MGDGLNGRDYRCFTGWHALSRCDDFATALALGHERER